MDPAVIGARLASSAVAPLIKKLFVTDGPGAGLVDKPVRISGLVSFRGEKRTLTEKDLSKLAADLVERGVQAAGPHDRLPESEREAVVQALARTLHGLGDLDMDDVQAVQLGPRDLSARLQSSNTRGIADLSADATSFHRTLVDTACLHILHFFTQRSTFVARTLVDQSRELTALTARVDELIARTRRADADDAAFETRYLGYIAKKHGQVTIYGIDLANSPERWPLDAAYLSLEATFASEPPQWAHDEVARYDTTTPVASWGAPVPADQALSGHDRVLLRGVAGSGKTTLIQWLAVTTAQQSYDDHLAHLRNRIPFVLPLRTLIRGSTGLPTPDRFLAAVNCPVAGAQPRGWADRVLTAGRGLLLVDGIDEIPERERERTRHWLRDLLGAFPGNLWLVTSRPSAVREEWLASDGFTELTLSPMSRDDVAAFIRRWHAAARFDTADTDRLDGYEQSLLEAVRTKQDLGRLATNPLMCGLICALHRDRRGYLPHGRKELYDAALSMLLSRRDRERDMCGPGGIELSEEPQIQLLQRLAYWLIRNGRTELDRAHAERIIAEALPYVPSAGSQGDADQIFRHLLVRSGLLREPTSGAVDFVHRTFQDYLGAKAAVENWDIGLLVNNAADSQWEDVIRMSVAHARPRERADILRELVAHGDRTEDRAVRTRVRLLAMACLEHATELDPAVRRAVEERAANLIPPRSPQEARALAAIGPIVLELLPGPEGLLEDEALNVVNAASQVGTDAAIPLLKRFRNHPSLGVRSELAWTWHRFETARYADEVIRHLPDDELYFVATTSAELRILKELGGRPRMHVRGAFSPQQLLEHLDPNLTHLWIWDNPQIHSLRFLRGFTELESLDLYGCRGVSDLSPLAHLPLRALATGEFSDSLSPLPTGLSVLSGLRHLHLYHRLPRTGLGALRLEAPLESLTLADPVGDDIFGVTAWPTLKHLGLVKLTDHLTPAHWEEISALPALESLGVACQRVGSPIGIPPSVHMPTLRTLLVTALDAGDDLTGLLQTIAVAFPDLRHLVVNGSADRLPAIDLSPLAALPRLDEVHLANTAPPKGTSSLPAATIRITPRPRS
ncbi:NACHT domain-containing protein [Streptomyces sp. KR80]|uniref:NACHT domain-containing protein n=1 Tax=Streptomyces sp. KR80 TaxID=3457426 RepID=UPI003FCF7ECC